MKYPPRRPTTTLALLRALVPQRALTYYEAQAIAELQANRFREVLGISTASLPEEAISLLPRIHVQREAGLPVSGLTYWHEGRWKIALNALEPEGRQRFSLAHEFKHIVDHAAQAVIYLDRPNMRRNQFIERIADYFAACLLMPKRHVKRLFGERRELIEMAKTFDVTPRAMQVRLSQLGLTAPTPRCSRMPQARVGLRSQQEGVVNAA